MIELHAIQNGTIKLDNGKKKNIQLGYIYTANRYILAIDKKSATIHFDEGVAENVSLDIFEVSGNIEQDKINTGKNTTTEKISNAPKQTTKE